MTIFGMEGPDYEFTTRRDRFLTEDTGFLQHSLIGKTRLPSEMPVVMPAVLQRMMRHKSILTTMRYYATGDAHALAQSIWETARKAG